MTKQIILASGSANRKTVMDSLHIEYTIATADIDEKSIRDADYSLRAEKIARAKAEKVVQEFPGSIVISGDSFAVNNGEVFEKPTTLEEAKEMLTRESGGQGIFYTGFCYLDPAKKINYSTTLTVEFSLRELSKTEIENYIKINPVLTWSGALFPGNAYGAGMIKEIKGSLSTFIYGFPVDLVIEYLRKSEVIGF